MARTLAIGDIHGCLTALRTLVDFVEPASDDVIITLGDYVDRGPDTRGVLDFMIAMEQSQTLIPLRGNHEIMMLDAREKRSWYEPWLRYGGAATLHSYAMGNGDGSFADIPETHIEFLESRLLAYYECDTHFFVHANAAADQVLNKQSDATLYWRRYGDPERHCSNKIMVCGHTIQESGLPRGNANAVCIDTWAYGDGWLTCLDVNSGTVWQANEAADTRQFALNETFSVVKTDRRN